MAPSTVRMVLVEGENGEGATVDQDAFPVITAAATGNAATSCATDQVLAAILGTRQGAAESGYRLASTGVTWVDPFEAAALRDALAAHRVENIMLVSAFLSAAALAQAYGTSIGYAHTGLLFIEPDCATLAVVDSGDGSITDVRRASLPNDDADAVAELTAMAAGASRLEPHPQGLFVVGSSGVDVAMIKAELDAATPLTVSVPTEPESALAHHYLGTALVNLQKYGEAEAEFREALKLEPSAQNHYALAACLMALNRYEEALGELEIASRLDPKENLYRARMQEAARMITTTK